MAVESLGKTIHHLAGITPASRDANKLGFNEVYECPGGETVILVGRITETAKALGAAGFGVGLALVGINMLRNAVRDANLAEGIVGAVALEFATESAKIAVRAIDNRILLGQVVREHEVISLDITK